MGCGQILARAQARAYDTLGPTYSLVLATPLFTILSQKNVELGDLIK